MTGPVNGDSDVAGASVAEPVTELESGVDASPGAGAVCKASHSFRWWAWRKSDKSVHLRTECGMEVGFCCT